MQLNLFSAPKMFAAATAIGTAGLIAVPGPAAQADPVSCTLDSPILTINVSDGSVYTIDWTSTHPTGGAKSDYENGKQKFGNATGPGVIPASPYPNIDFTINWGDVTNHITGQIDPTAGFAYGQAAKGNNNGGYTWSAQHEHWTCPTGQGPTAAGLTATVNANTDLYDKPNDNGDAVVIDMLHKGQVVKVTAPCSHDAWCILTDPVGAAWGRDLTNN
jgi:hypothetical protein